MFSTDPAKRAAYITGLRQLASFLDANPGVPVPEFGTTITVVASYAEHGGAAEIVAMSIELGAPFAEQDGTYHTKRKFGPVTYKGYSASAAALAEHDALYSYYGCVTPDD